MEHSSARGDAAFLVGLGGITLLAHLFIGTGYGFHRDELATLDDARRLAWGYVAYPPLTPFFGRLSLIVFGTSVVGFRFFAAMAAATSVALTGLIAREMGGGRAAQLIAAGAGLPFCLGCGSLMQYVAFDYLWWTLTSYLFIRLTTSGNRRLWLAIGASIGFGALTKYSILFCVAGLVAGVVLTNLRRHLLSKWLWIGVAISLAVFAPNLIWQLQHHFVSLDFLQHIHQRDIRIGRTKDFLPDQLELTFLAAPLAIAGLYFYLWSDEGRRFRAVVCLYLIPFVLFLVARGRGYYLAPAYSVLYAAGAVWLEHRFRALTMGWRQAANAFVGLVLLVNAIVAATVALPIAPINSRWWQFAAKVNSDLPEEIGWPDLVATIAHVRDSLSPNERGHVGILAGNYGEAAAINLYGPGLGLPEAICGTNSFWERGYGEPPPETVIAVGFSREFVAARFETFELIAKNTNSYRVVNEETRDNADIFLCHRLRLSWPQFWKAFRRYG